MKTIREICSDRNLKWEEMLVALEAREKERDNEKFNEIADLGRRVVALENEKVAELERVKAAVSNMSFTEGHRKSILDAIYPPPKPKTLPAGYWWVRAKGNPAWTCILYGKDFVPSEGYERRPWNDPPPEVTGKVAPLPDASRVSEFVVHTTTGIVRIAACSQDHAERIAKHDGHTLLPTFEEWGQKNVPGWEDRDRLWYRASKFPHSTLWNIPDNVFDMFDVDETANRVYPSVCYATQAAADAALMAALLKLGMIRP